MLRPVLSRFNQQQLRHFVGSRLSHDLVCNACCVRRGRLSPYLASSRPVDVECRNPSSRRNATLSDRAVRVEQSRIPVPDGTSRIPAIRSSSERAASGEIEGERKDSYYRKTERTTNEREVVGLLLVTDLAINSSSQQQTPNGTRESPPIIPTTFTQEDESLFAACFLRPAVFPVLISPREKFRGTRLPGRSLKICFLFPF